MNRLQKKILDYKSFNSFKNQLNNQNYCFLNKEWWWECTVTEPINF